MSNVHTFGVGYTVHISCGGTEGDEREGSEAGRTAGDEGAVGLVAVEEARLRHRFRYELSIIPRDIRHTLMILHEKVSGTRTRWKQ